jgi:hypothetical protein
MIGIYPGNVIAVEQDPASSGLDEAVHHLQRRRLATAGRADEHHDRTARDCQVQVHDGGRVLPGVGFPNPL